MNKSERPFSSVYSGSFSRLLLLAFVLLFGFTSCKTKQKITLNNGKCILDFKNARTLTAHLKASEFKFDRVNAKINVEANIDSADNSFTVTLRMKRDSVIWMSLSKLGIEGARVLISKDSVRFMNRTNNKYFVGDYAYLSKMLNTELDFEILQSLLVGNSVEFYDEDEKIKPGVDDCMYTLGTVRKKKIRKVVEKGKELKEPVQSIYMIPALFKIARIIFFEFNPDRSFDAHFEEYTRLESGQYFPMKMKYTIKAQKNVIIDLTYTKVALNEEQSFPFKIPETYEQIIYKEKK